MKKIVLAALVLAALLGSAATPAVAAADPCRHCGIT